MDPIAQLGRDAYHALCVAFAAQNKDKLYAPETDVLLEEARELLGVTEDEDSAIRAQIEKDPMIAALRRGELPPGGVRSLTPSSNRAAGGYSGMPPPASAGGLGGGAGFDTPFSNPMQQKALAAAKKPSSAPPAPPPSAAAAAGGGSSLVGRKLQRLFPDLSPPWVTGTIMQYNPSNGRHLIAYGPPLRKELWDCVEDFAPQNFRWVEPGSEPAPAAGGGGSKAGGGSKTGGGSKSAAKATTPKAPPPAPKAPVVSVPALVLPGGPSTFHATGVSLTAAPYNDGFLRSCIGKNRIEDLATMLSSIDDREVAVVREVVALLDDPGDVADINRLLEESQQLGQREQQLRAELRELGVTG